LSWLEKVDLPSLSYRRARGDAIETYKYLHRLYTVDSSHMLPQMELLPEDTVLNNKKETAGEQDTPTNELLWAAYRQ
jgi:hypothetical protein